MLKMLGEICCTADKQIKQNVFIFATARLIYTYKANPIFIVVMKNCYHVQLNQ